MQSKTDTIVALATPPGEGAIGIIRMSGDDAIDIAAKIFSGKKLIDAPTHTAHFGKIVDEKRIIDEVVITLYRAPRSYTGENIVEISCHGSQYVLEQVLDLCIRHGAVLARAGEFTLRAFLSGKMDLTQAEAVADLIASQTGAAHQAAMHNLRKGFSDELKSMREQLIQFSALIELELDFSQEDVTFADRTQLYNLINQLNDRTRKLIASFDYGNVVKKGVNVGIIGKPNAGKSTLLNALLNEDRAIVSDIAGTTRDAIEETLNINGILFRLIDTAGLRDSTDDVIEQMGMQRSRDIMKRADIVIYLYDVNTESPQDLELIKQQLTDNGKKYLLVANKIDKAQTNLQSYGDTIFISAKNNQQIDELKQQLYTHIVTGQVNTEDTVITNTRHLASLKEVQTSLQEIKAGMDNNIPGDLIALDIRRCLYYLGEITGEVTTEDKLDYIFSKFCIGK